MNVVTPNPRTRRRRQVDVVNRLLVRKEESEVGFNRIPALLIFVEESEDVRGNPIVRPHGSAAPQHVLDEVIVVSSRIRDAGANSAATGRPTGLRDHQRHVAVAEAVHRSVDGVHLFQI